MLHVLLAASTGPATAAPACTAETLNVNAVPVRLEYCVSGSPRQSGGQEIELPVAATYSGNGRSVSRELKLHFLAGERVSRVLESLDLSALGMTGTLHLTLAYADGDVRVEGALLTPGAITIK